MTISKTVEQRLFESIEENWELYIAQQSTFASDLQLVLIWKFGFQVEQGVAGHETAFYAVKDKKPGPTYLAEYDALPGLGHACNII